MQIGFIGLGKMGYPMVLNLMEKGINVVAYDKDLSKVESIIKESGAKGCLSIKDMFESWDINQRIIIWIMLPHQFVEDVLTEIKNYTKEGDVIIDGGNSHYKDSIKRYHEFTDLGAHFIDAGVNGGPNSTRHGGSIMVGGNKNVVKELDLLFSAVSCDQGYIYFGSSGAGHFVKMIHNGIEYGMMQSIAEGFDVLKNSPFDLNLNDAVKSYKHCSVIVSLLIDLLESGFNKYGQELNEVEGSAGALGEGEWTILEAKELGVRTPVLTQSFEARVYSRSNPNYQGKIINTLRNQFGGHPIKSLKIEH